MDPLARNLPKNGLPYGRSEEESQSLCKHGSVDANASELTKAYDIALQKRMGVYVEPAKKKAYFPELPGSK